MEGVQQHPGSWWTDWQAWISTQDSEQVEARDPAKGKLKALEDAPGSYVKIRADARQAAA
jgi:polyhydroxyalkanoate synthase